MKKLTLLFLFLGSSLATFAQWGIKGGIGISSLTGSSLFEPRFSGHVGGLYQLKLSDKWYLQPELLFVTTGANLKNDGSVLNDGYVKMYSFEIPINASFRPKIAKDWNLLLDLGLYARSAFSGSKEYLYHKGIEPNIVKGSPFDAYNRFDFGLNIGVGIQKSHYFMSLAYQRGMSHAAKNIGYYNQNMRLSIGYLF